MNSREVWLALTAVLVLLPGFLGPADAATKLKKPLLEDAPEEDQPLTEVPRQPQENPFVGSVIYVRGGQVVAEISGGAAKNEYVNVFDGDFRRKGKARVLQPLAQETFLLQRLGSFSVSPGDRLAKESESEAAARVFRAKDMDGYRSFLELFPETPYRPRVAREMFRLAMGSEYPIYPGSTVNGKMRLTERVGRDVPVGRVQIVLDRYVIASTDDDGGFRIEGIPRVEEPVTLKVRAKDTRFQMAEDVTIDLAAGTLEEVSVEVPVVLTPTILQGTVTDEKGDPLPGAEVWTSPYTMEVLTDEEGGYQISRRKRLEGSGTATGDEPLLGDEYEVYAHRNGYSVERRAVSAASHRSNLVPAIRLDSQDSRKEALPALGLDLKAHLLLDASELAVPRGATPMLNP